MASGYQVMEEVMAWDRDTARRLEILELFASYQSPADAFNPDPTLVFDSGQFSQSRDRADQRLGFNDMRHLSAQKAGLASGKKSRKLTNSQVKLIRSRAANGHSTRSLAREFEVDPKTIRTIIRLESYKHVSA